MAKQDQVPKPPRPPKPEGAKPRQSGGPKQSQFALRSLPDGRRQKETGMVIASTGVWTYESDNEKALFEGLEHDSDRAAAIIAGSMIDVRLTAAIKHRLRRDSVIENKLFQPSGPLGTFSSKIDLARLMGIISAPAYRDIHVVRDIRNSFAHDLKIRDFNTPSIRDRSMNLKMVDTHILSQIPNVPDQLFINVAPGSIPRIGVLDLAKKKKDSRSRYLLACSVVTVGLGFAEIMTAEELV